MARAEAEEKGADEALLFNTNGEVAETAGGNLFWVYQEKICTVPTGRGVLPGITRAVVLEICQSLGLQTNKRVIKPEALRNSEGIFVTQSALGIVPVASFDGEPVAPSPLVDQIARLTTKCSPSSPCSNELNFALGRHPRLWLNGARAAPIQISKHIHARRKKRGGGFRRLIFLQS